MKKFVLFTFISVSLIVLDVSAQNQECLDCHSDNTLVTERKGKEVSLYISSEHFNKSIHSELSCNDCHEDFDPDELPHRKGEMIFKVECSNCHDTEDYEKSIHNKKNITCFSCHSKHSIQKASTLIKQGPDFCITCHKDQAVKGYTQSIHYEKFKAGEKAPSCVDCHGNSAHSITKSKFSEGELHDLCLDCHENAVKNFESSLHGKALTKGKALAPNCITCHNSHKIESSKNPNSKTYKMNIPSLCGDCHKDGTKISELKSISQRHILEDYSESIHGDGLFKRGLIVSAVCTDCHFSHNILPHEDPNSSINRKNIPKTCTQCHVQIEKVHIKVIDGKLWEQQPNRIPACIDCHQPHKVRRVFYDTNFTDKLCISCHEKENIFKTVNGEKISLHIDIKGFKNSVHKDNSCVKCHTNVNDKNNPICLNSGKVDCSSCHAEHVENYNSSIHGTLFNSGKENAPYCTDCHGTHNTQSKKDVTSITFRTNIPKLCAKCHKHEGDKNVSSSSSDSEIMKNYAISVHGKGLLESGLTVTATCIDCHTSHLELPASDPLSSVSDKNIAETCATCHLGIYEKFRHSVHSAEVTETDKKLPNCSSCHESHTIVRIDVPGFKEQIMNQCGKCHKDVTETYFDTFHGKVSKLGSGAVAKCQDCHGSHDILPTYNPASKLSRNNIVETCKSCHPNSNKMFVGYLTHATHHDKEKYPILFYTFWAMTILLVSTFSFFGLHTLLWLPRALAEKKKQKRKKHGSN